MGKHTERLLLNRGEISRALKWSRKKQEKQKLLGLRAVYTQDNQQDGSKLENAEVPANNASDIVVHSGESPQVSLLQTQGIPHSGPCIQPNLPLLSSAQGTSAECALAVLEAAASTIDHSFHGVSDMGPQGSQPTVGEVRPDEHHFKDPHGPQGNGHLRNKVCKCVDTTVGDVVFMCLTVGLKHNLTWTAQVDILNMISTICNCPDIPTNKKAYLKLLGERDHTVTYHIFCHLCESYLGQKDEKVKEILCQTCSKTINQSNPSNFFLYISLESQLKSLLKNEKIVESLLTYRFKRDKKEGAISDIYDGEVYKRHFGEHGLLRNPYNFSWSFFVDGIQAGKSNGKTLWPLYLTINELCYGDRMKNMLMGGLYVGSKDPNPLVFLRPFVEEANKLALEGFEWVHRGKCVKSLVISLMGIMDSVARFKVLNMQSFKAYFGCTYCYQQQSRTATMTRRYAFAGTGAELRTHESTLNDAIIAVNNTNDEHCRGVKGPTILLALKYFDVIAGCPVDYMHCLLLGQMKTHMEKLFESSFVWVQLGRFASEHYMTSIDERLLQIHPPACITRVTRSIVLWRLWKASEWRSWLLFYSVPCLSGLLRDEHIVPIAMFSKATCLLLQRHVSLVDIDLAHRLFMAYYHYFEQTFDIQHTMYNIHLLSHICDSVRNGGPLWAQSAFPYEGQNMHLLQLYQSPRHVLLQIAKKFLIYKSLPLLCATIVTTESAVDFAESVTATDHSRYLKGGECLLSMKVRLSTFPEDERHFISESIRNHDVNVREKDCIFYQRALLRGLRVSSCDYATGKQRDDSVVFCTDGLIMQVTVLILLPSGEVRVVGRKICLDAPMVFESSTNLGECSLNKVTLTHVQRIALKETLVCVGISAVEKPAVHVTPSSDRTYVCGMPYGCYGD